MESRESLDEIARKKLKRNTILSRTGRQIDRMLGIEIKGFCDLRRLEDIENIAERLMTNLIEMEPIEGFEYQEVYTAESIARSRAAADAICQGNMPYHFFEGIRYFAGRMAERKAGSERMTDQTREIYVNELTEVYIKRLIRRVEAGAYGGSLDNAAFLHCELIGKTESGNSGTPRTFRLEHEDRVDLIGTRQSLKDYLEKRGD